MNGQIRLLLAGVDGTLTQDKVLTEAAKAAARAPDEHPVIAGIGNPTTEIAAEILRGLKERQDGVRVSDSASRVRAAKALMEERE